MIDNLCAGVQDDWYEDLLYHLWPCTWEAPWRWVALTTPQLCP